MKGGGATDWRRWLIGLALAAICFVGLDRALWTPDEPREAEISREMARHPTTIPTLDAARFYEKPPLYYWTVAALFAMTGGASIVAARFVSGAAGALTLLVVYLWGRRAVSPAAGGIAAWMLATSVTFFMTTHWVLIDPLLMLACAVAAWGGWERLEGGGTRWLVALWGGLVVALWIKGFVGPVLVGAGLAAAAWIFRRRGAWTKLAPQAGVAAGAVAVAALVAAIYLEGGRAALWQWGWVNHVGRFLAGEARDHRQAVYYYAPTLAVAIVPWLVPFLDLFTRSFWAATAPATRLRRYSAALVGAGLLVLTASATKRENYLLPLLPPLFLMMSLAVLDRLARAPYPRSLAARGWARAGEWLQAGLSAALVVVPGAAALAYVGRALPLAVALVVVAVPLAVALLVATAARRRRLAAGLAAVAAALFVVGGLEVSRPMLDPQKDFTPFVEALDRTLPAGAAVDAVGSDETLAGIVPFLTGRRVVDHPPDLLVAGPHPAYLLVQQKRGHPARIPGLVEHYRPLRRFGRGRELTLWQRLAWPAPRPPEPTSRS